MQSDVITQTIDLAEQLDSVTIRKRLDRIGTEQRVLRGLLRIAMEREREQQPRGCNGLRTSKDSSQS